jgi:flagellar basal body-associated protein FliL
VSDITTERPAASRSVLVGIAIGIAAATAGSVGGFYLLGPEIVKRKAEGIIERALEAAVDRPCMAAEAVLAASVFYEVPTLVANPAGSRGSRHVLLSVVLEVAPQVPSLAEEAVLELMRGRDVLIRDAVLRMLSGQTMETLTAPNALDHLAEQIGLLLQDVVPEVEARKILFPQFILQ